jgi:hypothetical protein
LAGDQQTERGRASHLNEKDLSFTSTALSRPEVWIEKKNVKDFLLGS